MGDESALLEGVYQQELRKVEEEIEKLLGYETTEALDKRRAPRVPVTFPITYIVYRGNQWDRQEREMQALNISAVGLKVISPEKIIPGNFVAIRFQLRPEVTLHALGQVRWLNRVGGSWLIGIEFRNPDRRQWKTLEQYVHDERARWFVQVSRKTGKERRKFFRILTEITIPSFFYSGTLTRKWRQVSQPMLIIDLSGGGARVRCARGMATGDLLSFELPLEKELVEIIAHIVWQRSERGLYMYGLKFVGLEETHRDSIIRFVILHEQRLRRAD